MIDPKEFAKDLRIGNWLNPEEEEFKGKYFQIDAGDIKHIREGMQRYKYEPIPLSSDILIACGFEKAKTSNEYWTFWKLENGWHICESHHDEFSAGVAEGFFYWGEDYAEISSLHKLQNLYFALTNKELQYNPQQ